MRRPPGVYRKGLSSPTHLPTSRHRADWEISCYGRAWTRPFIYCATNPSASRTRSYSASSPPADLLALNRAETKRTVTVRSRHAALPFFREVYLLSPSEYIFYGREDILLLKVSSTAPGKHLGPMAVTGTKVSLHNACLLTPLLLLYRLSNTDKRRWCATIRLEGTAARTYLNETRVCRSTPSFLHLCVRRRVPYALTVMR